MNVKLTYFGHACFLAESGGTRIVLDPYCDDSVPGLRPIRLKADAVFCSHSHGDHSGAKCVTLTERATTGWEAERFSVPHDHQNGALRGMSDVIILNFNGIRVVHLGDLGRILTEAELDRIRHTDCLLIPVGGHYTIDAAEAQKMIHILKPRIAIPMHYRTADFGLKDIAPLQDFTYRCPEVHFTGSKLEITKSTPDGIWVLHPAGEGVDV